MVNFFELLNQDPCFDIDLNVLEIAFIEAQKQAHPDNCLGDSNAHFQSAQINQAYMTLKDPFKRAVYYLSLKGIILEEEEAMSPAFLMQQMEMRERLEEAETPAEKAPIYSEIKTVINEQHRLISQLLAAMDFKTAAKAVKELRFWLVLEQSYVATTH
jgi:molecular chaperone HscB